MTNLNNNFTNISNYILAYCERYFDIFKSIIDNEAEYYGLPKVLPPSFASTDPIECWITKNGVLIIDQIVRQDQWYVVGGPAMKVDFTVSRTPDWVRKIISENFVDKPIGIYRVAKDEIPNRLWVGELPKFTRQYSKTTSFGKIINFKIVQNTLSDSLARLTYGALGYVLDFPLRQQTADFWDNIRIEEWGFFPADLSSTRFFKLLEICHDTSAGAWDTRGLWLRTQFECYRDVLLQTDFMGRVSSEQRQGEWKGSISFAAKSVNVVALGDRTRRFEKLLDDLQNMLNLKSDEYERIFQEFLEKNSELIDLYGKVFARPKFKYPNGTSPTGKTYIEPDFVVSYPDGKYRVIEIERPNKKIATSTGQPKSEATQASFQISEFRNFIGKHANVLQTEFPNITLATCTFTIIIGRKTAHDGSIYSSIEELRNHIRETFRSDDFLFYEDIIERGRTALNAFRGLSRLAS